MGHITPLQGLRGGLPERPAGVEDDALDTWRCPPCTGGTHRGPVAGSRERVWEDKREAVGCSAPHPLSLSLAGVMAYLSGMPRPGHPTPSEDAEGQLPLWLVRNSRNGVLSGLWGQLTPGSPLTG